MEGRGRGFQLVSGSAPSSAVTNRTLEEREGEMNTGPHVFDMLYPAIQDCSDTSAQHTHLHLHTSEDMWLEHTQRERDSNEEKWLECGGKTVCVCVLMDGQVRRPNR
ncbi:hypothetical protein PGIGA_G00157310 [Pangasianodon gigas]|uniref:Uncharacterized protein n=1 Tax=Pangasianodon gigas TaxID=30993 RepID=A0ACC5XR44_PANGG|nr:hypothetical protein [Pangasianodon gigas]